MGKIEGKDPKGLGADFVVMCGAELQKGLIETVQRICFVVQIALGLQGRSDNKEGNWKNVAKQLSFATKNCILPSVNVI